MAVSFAADRAAQLKAEAAAAAKHELDQLRFLRWLVQQGKLSDFGIETHPEGTARMARERRAALLAPPDGC